MECLLEDPMLKFHPDTLQTVRRVYGMDKPGEMSEAVDILDSWVKQQDHFIKKDFTRDYLERMIITTKGSVERAKQRLDKICTFRTLMPHFFGDFELQEDFKDITNNTFILVVLPEMTKENDRVVIVKPVGDKIDVTKAVQSFKTLFVYCEYLRAHDYSRGIKIIGDYCDCSITALIAALRPTELHQGFTVMLQGYGLSMKGLYLLSESKLVNGIAAIFKQVVSTKLSERIIVHKTVDTLYEVVPKDILPKEYGGKQKSYLELRDEWLKILSSKEFIEYQREMNAARTDESLRQTDTFNEQYMGMPGTFRTLRVD